MTNYRNHIELQQKRNYIFVYSCITVLGNLSNMFTLGIKHFGSELVDIHP